MSYKTSQLTGIFCTQIRGHKSAKKTTFALSKFVLHLVCHIGMYVLNKNAKKNTFVVFVSGLGKTHLSDWSKPLLLHKKLYVHQKGLRNVDVG